MYELMNNISVENVQDDAANVDTQVENQTEPTAIEPVENVQDDAVKEPEKVYKSQEEIDRAFAKRLERERKKLEREFQKKYEKDLLIANEIKRIYGENFETALESIKQQKIEELAEELGLPYEAARKIYELENRSNNSIKANNVDDTFLDYLLEQEKEIQNEYPDFDITKAIDEDEDFAKMIISGVNPKKAFYASRFDEIYPKLEKQIEEKVVERIKNRNQIPNTMVKQSQSQTHIDITKLTTEQLNELAERARRGEKIIL